MFNKGYRPTRAYLLRCWQEDPAVPGGKPRWRYSLEGILPRRSRKGFDDLESLVVFLQSQAADDEEEWSSEEYETEVPKWRESE
jgi:hypothetical protein